jgi:tetratricopeptide (TPR) repeat protein
MKPIHKFALLGLFILFSFHFNVFSGQVTGAAEGYIKNIDTGEPIVKVKVTLIYAKSEIIKYELYTDKKGHFYRTGLTPGIYRIAAEKEGYLPRSSSIRVKLGDTAKVDMELKSFESTAPKSVKTSNQGSKLLNTGKYEEAIKKFTEAIEEEQANPVFYYYRAAAFEKTGSIDQALEDYKKSIELKPDFVLPISRVGIIYAKNEDFEKAAEFYKTAVELGDQDATNHYNYGVCLMNLRSNTEAKAVFEKLLILDKNYSDACYQLGIIYIGLGEVAKAKEFLQKFIDMDPENKHAAIAKEILKSLNLPLAILL